MQFTLFRESRQGRRKSNQDRIVSAYTRDSLVLCVADGMGGHAGGEIAAQIAVRLLVERFEQQATPALADPAGFLRESISSIHRALGEYAERMSLIETPRTTFVGCVVQEGHATWAHVGDSRLYLFRGGRAIGRTRDHSKVQFLIDQGLIDPQAATSHPERNRLYSCLGGFTDPTIDVSERTRLRSGDLLLLCSDGLWAWFNVDEICRGLTLLPILSAGPLLMDEAERRAGPECDNLSVVALRWGTDGADAGPSTVTDALLEGQVATALGDPISISRQAGEQRDLTDDEIERAIQEIQSTIRRHGGTGGKRGA